MTFGGFTFLVEAMREAQKAYFKNRTTNYLAASIRFEQEVDKALKAMKQEPTLFGEALSQEPSTAGNQTLPVGVGKRLIDPRASQD